MMLPIPGLSRVSPVARGFTLLCHARRTGIWSSRSQRWGLLVRCCGTSEVSSSKAPPPAVDYQTPFANPLEGLAALIALSTSGKIIGKDAHGNIVVKDAEDAGNAGSGVKEVKEKKKAVAKVPKKEEELKKKDIRSPKVKKVPTPEPKFSKAARRFFNMRFRKAERLSKVMAAAGVASRRACEEIIFAGKVVVNGKVCRTPETHVDPLKDLIYIDGKPIPRRLPPKMVFALYKPKGYICSDAKDDKKTVYLLLEKYLKTWEKNNPGLTKPRFFTVGRLDVATTGLIFVTNDGEFAQKVSHPSSGITKEYLVTVDNESVTKRQLKRIASGTEIDGVMCVPISVELVKSEPGDSRHRIRVVVTEGRNHEVRQLVESAFLKVHALKRVRVGGLRLPSKLSSGMFIQLTQSQIKQVVERDPVLLETGRAPLPLASSASGSKDLVLQEEEKSAAVAAKNYPLTIERKEVQAIIESNKIKPLMMEEVRRVVSVRKQHPTRRVRAVVFK
ncbi:putative ribosomal large subunit pseudouridine synthase SVR1, chloroplastic [Selaginella moellendorffii]|nr:putative ribosomal large subunit pseudouridine synthase SVR1, chloroplastic [Selaginella moellendorffii]|eukprot:XP_002991422.2 putative ribosomal large subunit pseudouridine synthase SVR1, chloroplastic [Selaginella moellendorffii]